MAEPGGTSDVLGRHMELISSKVQSKIFFHQDAVIEYMNMKNVINELTEEKKKMEEKHHCLEQERHAMKELVESLEQQLVTANEEIEEAKVEWSFGQEEIMQVKGELVALKEKLKEMTEKYVASKEEIGEAKAERMAAKEGLARKEKLLDEKNEEVLALRNKLQKTEARNTHLEQQHGSAPEPVQSRRETRSSLKRKMMCQGFGQ